MWTARRQKVKDLHQWLHLNNPEYKHTAWSEAAELLTFGSLVSYEDWTETPLDLPVVEHGHRDDDDDVGPAQEQLGVAAEDGETTTGFVAAACLLWMLPPSAKCARSSPASLSPLRSRSSTSPRLLRR